jgi:uncharacterized coiled-coil DUF342 family protein
MIPLNKVMKDVQDYVKECKREIGIVKKTEATVENELAALANDLSNKYAELISVRLVKSLIIACRDAEAKAAKSN